MDTSRTDPRSDLHASVRRLYGLVTHVLRCIPLNRSTPPAPAEALRAALAGEDVAALIDAGDATVAWVTATMTEEERFDQDVGMPLPEFDGFALARVHALEATHG